jgi:hypothetical protein
MNKTINLMLVFLAVLCTQMTTAQQKTVSGRLLMRPVLRCQG